MQKGFVVLWIIVGVVLTILGVGTFVYGQKVFTKKAQTPKPEQKACTLEAKICADGSSVGREGSSCEFAACPIPSLSPIASSSAVATDSAQSVN